MTNEEDDMTARDELIARVEARLSRAEHVESRSAEIPVSDLRAILTLATAPDGREMIDPRITPEMVGAAYVGFENSTSPTISARWADALTAALATAPPIDQSAEITRLTAEVETLTAERASFPSIDRAGPIVTAPGPNPSSADDEPTATTHEPGHGRAGGPSPPPEPDVATEAECRHIPRCHHGVIIFGDRVTCDECDEEVTSLKLGWIPWAGGPCPVVPHTQVDLRFIGGDEHYNVDGYVWTVWSWKRVVAYRLVTP